MQFMNLLFVFFTRLLVFNLVLALSSLSFNFCCQQFLVYEQEGEPSFIWTHIKV